MRFILTEEEFDDLPEQSQKYYTYCPECGHYYRTTTGHLCEVDDL